MVIHTYSVIIQNQKTMEAFSQYQPLFTEAINSGMVGVCKWIESGTTVDTALPELNSLTDDKEEWRAVIVRYIDDHGMASFESDARNPYDFLINQGTEDIVEESPVPLIRLTQMLGGVPPLEVKFKAEVLREPHKAPRTIYVPVDDTQREQAHRALTKKYAFNGKLPSSILIISVRDKSYQEENLGRSWLSHKESESSEFWKRNHFPSVCRFMVYDIEKQGPVQKEADDFGFWYSVMLMAVNEWDSGTIQAYRLYTLGISVNPEAMSESFQMLADRLRDAKHYIERSIRKDVESQMRDELGLPDFKLDVPVALNLPKTDDCTVKKLPFHLLSEGANTDIAAWSKARQSAENILANSIRSAERTLDRTADKMRANCTFAEEDVLPLGKYQTEDLKQETGKLYQQIVRIQSDLPKEDVSSNAELQSASDKVKEQLLGRVTRQPAIITIILAALLVLLSAIPAFVHYITEHHSSLPTIAYVLCGCVLVVTATALFVLISQKAKLDLFVLLYNQRLKNAYNKLVESAGDYSAYMSGIASHARGCSYLNISDRKKYAADVDHFSKYKHVKAISVMLGKLRAWSRAYHLNVDFASKRPETRVDVDVTVAPVENKLYSFATGELYPVAINHSGMSMSSPYPFASRIAIIREELYEDE